MGQYHLTVNLDRKEFLNPHTLGNGLKLFEQVGSTAPGVSTALMVLLACSNGRGLGDVSEHPLVGRWAGNRIAVVGDYAEKDDLPADVTACDASQIYDQCRSQYCYIKPIPDKAGRTREGEVFYLGNDRESGLWKRIDEGFGTPEAIEICNLETHEVRDLVVSMPILIQGMESGTWCDISWAMADYIEHELLGTYTGTGWRLWKYDEPIKADRAALPVTENALPMAANQTPALEHQTPSGSGVALLQGELPL